MLIAAFLSKQYLGKLAGPCRYEFSDPQFGFQAPTFLASFHMRCNARSENSGLLRRRSPNR